LKLLKSLEFIPYDSNQRNVIFLRKKNSNTDGLSRMYVYNDHRRWGGGGIIYWKSRGRKEEREVITTQCRKRKCRNNGEPKEVKNTRLLIRGSYKS
jgi:hypothetical protein